MSASVGPTARSVPAAAPGEADRITVPEAVSIAPEEAASTVPAVAVSTAEAADTNSDSGKEKLLRDCRGFFHSRMLLIAEKILISNKKYEKNIK